jgi:hypothetical protein
MNKSQNLLLNGCLIGLGAILLVCTMFVQRWLLLFQVSGIVALMTGAYRSSVYRSEGIENNKDEEE